MNYTKQQKGMFNNLALIRHELHDRLKIELWKIRRALSGQLVALFRKLDSAFYVERLARKSPPYYLDSRRAKTHEGASEGAGKSSLPLVGFVNPHGSLRLKTEWSMRVPVRAPVVLFSTWTRS